MQFNKPGCDVIAPSQPTSGAKGSVADQRSAVTARTISLPKGAIATSPGRSGFGLQLSLSYDSGAGNGPFGLGWNLSLPCVTRKTDKALPKYQDVDESDVFILSGAEDLVPRGRKLT
jgi:hypothetical protein